MPAQVTLPCSLPTSHADGAVFSAGAGDAAQSPGAQAASLLDLATADVPDDALLSTLVVLARTICGAKAVAWLECGNAGEPVLGPYTVDRTVARQAAQVLNALRQTAGAARQQQQFVQQMLPDGMFALAMPVARDAAACDVLAMAIEAGDEHAARRAQSGLQLVAMHCALRGELQSRRDAQLQWSELRRGWDAMQSIAAAADLPEGCRRAALLIGQQMPGCLAAVGVSTLPSGECRLQAFSGPSQFDPRTEAACAVQAAMQLAVERRATIVWPETSPEPTTSHGELAEVARQLSQPSVLVLPLIAGEQPIGCLLIAGPVEALQRHSQRDALALTAAACATPLHLLKRREPSGVERAARKLSSVLAEVGGPRRWKYLALAAVLLLAPVPYRVTCSCQLEPVLHRYVAAPFDGVLEHSLVEPGDVVHAGQLLGSMDSRELDLELASLLAEEQRAGKSRDMNLAGSQVAAAQISRLEMERANSRRELLANRAGRLDVCSPIDGVIISGDLKRSEGVPVTMGQPLFEVAPLERMVAELAVHDVDISHVEIGQRVTLSLDACPGSVWSGEIVKLQPRSESRDDRNVFIAEVQLDNDAGQLRPGMKGRAKIHARWHTLGWILLHRPLESLVTWLAW